MPNSDAEMFEETLRAFRKRRLWLSANRVQSMIRNDVNSARSRAVPNDVQKSTRLRLFRS